MDIINKSFKDNKTGEVIKIVDAYQNIAITDSKDKIDARRLLDPAFYTEFNSLRESAKPKVNPDYVDPKDFFNNDNVYSSFVNKIKNVDLSKIPEDEPEVVHYPSSPNMPTTNESAIVMSDDESEIEELKRKYGATTLDSSALSKQNEAFSRLIGDDDELPKVQQVVKREVKSEYIEPDTRVEQSIKQIQKTETTHVVPVSQDPITSIFRNAKRNINLSVNIEVSNKIPRIDFIEMMEDSYDISIIDFLADEFTRQLLANPSFIKERFIDEIKSLLPKKEAKVEEVKAEVKPKATPRKKAVAKKDDK